MKAVIQAGGKGTRIRPYSLVLPKPLMPIGESPVIETLLKWLRRNNIKQVYITIGYLGHLIRTVCGNGSQWDLEIHYSEESEPLGTVGPLSLISDHLNDTFIMLNGDLITDLDLRSLILFHKSKKGMVTIATTMHNIHTNLGIIENDNSGSRRVKGFSEKPIMKFQVSMGIYCIEPSVLELIPKGVPFGFDDLMYTMLEKNLPIYAFEHEGHWLDLGRTEDFLKAQKKFSEGNR
jgi:mannose-1-phosphate guanylyltransferase